MTQEGYIKLHRQMTAWEWYGDTNTKVVFLHLLLTANYEPHHYKGELIAPGEAVYGLSAMAKTLRLTVSQVRTALDHLQATGEIAIRTTSKFSVASIENWASFQNRTQIANKSHAESIEIPTSNTVTAFENRTKIATLKEIKKKEKEKEINKERERETTARSTGHYTSMPVELKALMQNYKEKVK